MKIRFETYIFPVFLFSALTIFSSSFSQVPSRTIITGKIVDALTGEPIPFVSVALKGTTVGALTDLSGNYKIETFTAANTVTFSYIGYQTVVRTIIPGTEHTINISLKYTPIAIDEVIVKPDRRRYRNKGNPAVELIEKVIAHKKENMPGNYDFLEYKKYEKIQFAFSNISSKFKERNLSRKFGFVFNNIDTTRRVGNDILPLFIKESIISHYYRKSPEETKELILAEKTINLDEYLSNKGVSAYLDHVYQNINIYDNEILFLTNKFLSPIASTAPIFYKFFILDTLTVGEIKCVRLFFQPRNTADFLFNGNLYITLDSTYAVRKIDMGINEKVNLDWIQDVIVTQDFDRFGQKTWLLSKEEISIDFGVIKNSMGLFGQRTNYFKDYKINEPLSEKIFRGPDKIEKTDPLSLNSTFWENSRFAPLTKTEQQIYTTIDSLQNMPAFRRRMELFMLVASGYLKLDKIEIGQMSTFYSFNSVEGSRMKFGGRTSTNFSKKITFEAFAAYGLNDRVAKYNAGITYSLTPRSIFEFPVKSLKFSYYKDTRIPGLEFTFLQTDNIFLSAKRGADDKLLLNNTLKFEYLNEFENHFSYLTGFNFTRQESRGNLYFNTDFYGTETHKINSLNINEIFLNLRYAPNESFYQGRVYRTPYPNQYPVIQLKMSTGAKMINNDFDYLRMHASISRRYYVSVIGYTDISLEAGKIFGKVPYPLLYIHRGNQTYVYQSNSYNLMNFLEFVSDRYVSFSADYSFNGFILNKVPLVKKLKFRELMTCKILYGGVTDNNNPDYQSDLFKFPLYSDGIPLTYTLEKKPYIEASIGVSNILRVLRVDLIRRLTYTDNPYVSNMGIRFQFKLDF